LTPRLSDSRTYLLFDRQRNPIRARERKTQACIFSMKHPEFFVACAVMLASYITLHLYSAGWLARSFNMSPGALRNARLIFLLLAFLPPFTMFLRRAASSWNLEYLSFFGFLWMGLILIAGSAFIFYDAVKFISPRWFAAAPPERLPLYYALFLCLIAVYSLYEGLKVPPLKEIELKVPELPPQYEGLRLAQISDIHIDSRYQLERFLKIAGKVSALNPDYLLFTGDFIDPGMKCGDELATAVKGIHVKKGVFGSLGNHEYYYGPGNSYACYDRCGIKLLKNETADSGGVKITGINDIRTAQITAGDLDRILKEVSGDKFSIILSHQPLLYREIAQKGRFLVLSGHVHRGQIFPFNLFTRIFYGYFYGLYRIEDSFFYVTSGAGAWGPPMRLLAPSEIPVIKLIKQRTSPDWSRGRFIMLKRSSRGFSIQPFNFTLLLLCGRPAEIYAQ